MVLMIRSYHIILLRHRMPLSIAAIFMMTALFQQMFISLLALVILLPHYLQQRKCHDQSELYHLLSGNRYAEFLIQKTIALALHINLMLLCFHGAVSIFHAFYKHEAFHVVSFAVQLLQFNSGLFIAFLIGDAIRLSDLNKLHGFWYKVIDYVLFSISFGICFSLIFAVASIWKENILIHTILCIFIVVIWYFNGKRYIVIEFKNHVIPSIYDRD